MAGTAHLPETLEDGRANGRKSAAAFRTISEVAQDLDVAQHVLRFWESKFPQVRPLKRGGGRRYYRPEDVDVLRQIRSLLYEQGYTIKGAQQCLRGNRRRTVTPPEPANTSLPAPVLAAAASSGPALPPELRARLHKLRDDLLGLRRRLDAEA